MQRMNPGQKFGKWTTVEKVKITQASGKTVYKWKCICECGFIGIVAPSDLTRGKSTKCRGCFGSLPYDLIGKKFGLWTVIKEAPRQYRRSYWWCKCVCGNEHSVSQQTLLNGSSTQCVDCYYKSKEGPTSKHKKHPLYNIWMTMLARCQNPNHKMYHRYGGRGISVCERWQILDNFYSDMGDRPTSRHTIDRIDNDGNYEPSNCRWATYRQQGNNKSTNHNIAYKGITKTMSEWAREMNIKPDTLYHYLKRNSFEKAINHYKYSDNTRTEFSITELKDE